MKCPKCAYLGFETGDRCKNCGYDFSLLAASFDPATEPGISLRPGDVADESMDMWLRDLDRSLPESSVYGAGVMTRESALKPLADARGRDTLGDGREDGEEIDVSLDPLKDLPEAVIAPPEPTPHLRSVEPVLPLYVHEPDDNNDNDAPMIAFPAAPRPPLAVRRTPDVPRLRAVSRLHAVEPTLDLRGTSEEPSFDDPRDRAAAGEADTASVADGGHAPVSAIGGRRLAAALIDHLILLSIDLAVLYFTVRMVGLRTAEWQMIPAVPTGIFLALMAFAYFTAFAAVGGQTIGKMATGIRVVGEGRATVTGPAATLRTLAALLSYATVGLAYLPGFLGARRTVHDRLAGTRVVDSPSA
jgi:uncharacterized RDD family membrane protein YckC